MRHALSSASSRNALACRIITTATNSTTRLSSSWSVRVERYAMGACPTATTTTVGSSIVTAFANNEGRRYLSTTAPSLSSSRPNTRRSDTNVSRNNSRRNRAADANGSDHSRHDDGDGNYGGHQHHQTTQQQQPRGAPVRSNSARNSSNRRSIHRSRRDEQRPRGATGIDEVDDRHDDLSNDDDNNNQNAHALRSRRRSGPSPVAAGGGGAAMQEVPMMNTTDPSASSSSTTFPGSRGTREQHDIPRAQGHAVTLATLPLGWNARSVHGFVYLITKIVPAMLSSAPGMMTTPMGTHDGTPPGEDLSGAGLGLEGQGDIDGGNHRGGDGGGKEEDDDDNDGPDDASSPRSSSSVPSEAPSSLHDWSKFFATELPPEEKTVDPALLVRFPTIAKQVFVFTSLKTGASTRRATIYFHSAEDATTFVQWTQYMTSCLGPVLMARFGSSRDPLQLLQTPNGRAARRQDQHRDDDENEERHSPANDDDGFPNLEQAGDEASRPPRRPFSHQGPTSSSPSLMPLMADNNGGAAAGDADRLLPLVDVLPRAAFKMYVKHVRHYDDPYAVVRRLAPIALRNRLLAGVDDASDVSRSQYQQGQPQRNYNSDGSAHFVGSNSSNSHNRLLAGWQAVKKRQQEEKEAALEKTKDITGAAAMEEAEQRFALRRALLKYRDTEEDQAAMAHHLNLDRYLLSPDIMMEVERKHRKRYVVARGGGHGDGASSSHNEEDE